MRALTIRQPYAWLIVTGQKTIENRTWSTEYRGPMLIHAATEMHEDSIRKIEDRWGVRIDRDALLRGGFIGRVDIVDVVRRHPSPWFQGPYGWVLARPRVVTFTPARGFQHLFNAPAL